MDAYQFNLVGLTLDIVGAFLVSVEAIKLENLRRLRDKVLRPMHQSILPKKLTIVDDETPLYDQQPLPPGEIEFAEGLRRWLLWHGLAGIFGVSLTYLALGAYPHDVLDLLLNWVSGRSTLTLVALALPVAAIAVILILAIGEAVHYGLIYLSRLPIAALDAIDKRTPSGTIGILGFTFLLFGFLLQMVATVTAYKTR